MVIVIIAAILFSVAILVLRYQVEGETNLPFDISSIKIISSTDAVNNEDTENQWNLTISQNNDVYIEILKNGNYGKTEIIDNIILDNFSIDKKTETGTQLLYKPSSDKTVIFKNSDENKVEDITFLGDLESNLKELKISNQGGMLAFRITNENVSTYISNEETEVNYSNLLKNTGVNLEDLQSSVTFDLTINLTSGKSYKANIALDIPVDDVVEQGTTSQEITDTSNIIFKRIENN
jgi:hypothetical protein